MRYTLIVDSQERGTRRGSLWLVFGPLVLLGMGIPVCVVPLFNCPTCEHGGGVLDFIRCPHCRGSGKLSLLKKWHLKPPGYADLSDQEIPMIQDGWGIYEVIETFGVGMAGEARCMIYPARGEAASFYAFGFDSKLKLRSVLKASRNSPEQSRILWPPEDAGRWVSEMPPFHE